MPDDRFVEQAMWRQLLTCYTETSNAILEKSGQFAISGAMLPAVNKSGGNVAARRCPDATFDGFVIPVDHSGTSKCASTDDLQVRLKPRLASVLADSEAASR
jgi:hypothetical protein